MRVCLSRAQRTLLLVFAAFGYALAAADAASLRVAHEGAGFEVRISPVQHTVAIAAMIRRDPFAPTPSPRTNGANAGATETRAAADVPGFAAIPPGLTVPDVDGEDNQNRGADGLIAMRNLILKATISGAHPVAYVQDGASFDIVRPGDRIGGRIVAAIDLRGIVFDDGGRLELSERARPARDAARPASTASPSPVPSASPGSAPDAQSLESTPATPGPLPTVKPDAYPSSGRPTPDPAAPTAFPYPYPYAPH